MKACSTGAGITSLAMGVRKTQVQAPGYYFITFTNYGWLPLFALSGAYDLVYEWFDYLRRQGHQIIAYVIMPNHIHLMMAYSGSGKSINTLVGNGKRLMAYGISRRLLATQQTAILQQLAAAVPEGARARGKQYAVFRPSFHLLQCYSQQFIVQKLRYIHNNPCAGKWMLAEHPAAYPHSSAVFYESGHPAAYPVVSWLSLEAWGCPGPQGGESPPAAE